MGELPANVDVRLVPPEPAPVPDLAEVDLVVPFARTRGPLLELLAGPPGRLRVIQTTSAGVDWLDRTRARARHGLQRPRGLRRAARRVGRGSDPGDAARPRAVARRAGATRVGGHRAARAVRPARRHPRPRVDRDGDRGPAAAVRRRGDRRGSNRARRRARPGRPRRGPPRRRDPREHAAADQRDQRACWTPDGSASCRTARSW